MASDHKKISILCLVNIATVASIIVRLPCKQFANFSVVQPDYVLQGSIIATFLFMMEKDCQFECLMNALCKSVNSENGGNMTCHLNSQTPEDIDDKVKLAVRKGWTFSTTNYSEPLLGENCKTVNPCGAGVLCKDTCVCPGYQCYPCPKDRIGLHCQVADSCKEIYEDKPGSASGVYDLRSGKHHCVMTNLNGCGGGGWTLAMKIDGTKSTFNSTSSYWESDTTYNVENGLKSFENEEAKFPGFSSISFKSICLGMKASGTTVWIRVTTTKSSLADVFKTGNYQETKLPKSQWMSLIDGAKLQSNCNRQGFNVKSTKSKMFVRIGIISNQQNDCSTPNSFVGFGSITTSTTTVPPFSCGTSLSSSISCGNFAECSNRDQSIAAMGYILVQ